MNDTQLTAIIVGLTGIIRTRLPKVDGIVVPAIAMAVGATLSALAAPDRWREALVHGVAVALAAVGGMTAIAYAGSKVGAAIGTATASETSQDEAPSAPSNPTDSSAPAAHT